MSYHLKMKTDRKPKILIVDTSAILSGKPLDFKDFKIVTAPGIKKELKPGGRDYRSFEFLIEKGLTIYSPSKESIKKMNGMSKKTGDIGRLSETDLEILAIAFEIKERDIEEPIILTDDYSIQNVAQTYNIRFETISQKGITKRFKWNFICRGCGKKFKDNIKFCPICGAQIKNVVTGKKDIKK